MYSLTCVQFLLPVGCIEIDTYETSPVCFLQFYVIVGHTVGGLQQG